MIGTRRSISHTSTDTFHHPGTARTGATRYGVPRARSALPRLRRARASGTHRCISCVRMGALPFAGVGGAVGACQRVAGSDVVIGRGILGERLGRVRGLRPCLRVEVFGLGFRLGRGHREAMRPRLRIETGAHLKSA
ncbi:hypothetical protein GCM10022221_00430 [Actinocorallia aurea]